MEQQLLIIASFATAGTSAVLAVLTYFYVRDVRRQVRAQTSPCVILYASLVQSRRSLIQLVVKNVGTAMAYNVRFKLSDPLPQRAWGLDEKTAAVANTMDCGPLIDGIPTLAPGETRVIDWGQYAGLKKNLDGKHIEGTCSFTDGKSAMLSTRAVLEVDSFQLSPAVDSEGAQVIRHLEKLIRAVERFSLRQPIRVRIEPAPTEDEEDQQQVA